MREKLYDTGDFSVDVRASAWPHMVVFTVRDKDGRSERMVYGYVRPWPWPFAALRPSSEMAARRAIRFAEEMTRRVGEQRSVVEGVKRVLEAEGDVRAIVSELDR